MLRLATRADAPAIATLSRDRIEWGLGWRWTAARVLRSIGERSTNVVVAGDGERVLGLAPEPRSDKGVPFNQLAH